MTTTVTLYTKQDCVQCGGTKRKLDKEGVVYETVDLSAAYADIAPAEDRAEAQRFVDAIKEMGHMQMPVLIVSRPGEEDIHWSGNRPDLIMKHLVNTGEKA